MTERRALGVVEMGLSRAFCWGERMARELSQRTMSDWIIILI